MTKTTLFTPAHLLFLGQLSVSGYSGQMVQEIVEEGPDRLRAEAQKLMCGSDECLRSAAGLFWSSVVEEATGQNGWDRFDARYQLVRAGGGRTLEGLKRLLGEDLTMPNGLKIALGGVMLHAAEGDQALGAQLKNLIARFLNESNFCEQESIEAFMDKIIDSSRYPDRASFELMNLVRHSGLRTDIPSLIRHLDFAVKRHDDYPFVLLTFSMLLSKLGYFEEASNYIDRYRQSEKDLDQITIVEELVYRIQDAKIYAEMNNHEQLVDVLVKLQGVVERTADEIWQNQKKNSEAERNKYWWINGVLTISSSLTAIAYGHLLHEFSELKRNDFCLEDAKKELDLIFQSIPGDVYEACSLLKPFRLDPDLKTKINKDLMVRILNFGYQVRELIRNAESGLSRLSKINFSGNEDLRLEEPKKIIEEERQNWFGEERIPKIFVDALNYIFGIKTSRSPEERSQYVS